MNHEKVARKIVAEAVQSILKEPEHKFAVAQLAIRALGAVISDLLDSERFTPDSTALRLQKELLDQIEKACI